MPLSLAATDAELVEAIRRGQEDAIRWLVERYSSRLFRYLTRLVGEAALAEDILQDTWLRVVERLDRYDRAKPFEVWIFAVARHRAIDALRRRARVRKKLGQPAQPLETEQGDLLDPLEMVAATGPSPLDVLTEAETEQRIADAFARLPQHYREALTLRFHEEMRLDEIARLLEVPLSTVKTRVQRGLLLLRQRAEHLGLQSR
jgi:RNA polymerase sigma-70 factor (ECF subfamily)